MIVQLLLNHISIEIETRNRLLSFGQPINLLMAIRVEHPKHHKQGADQTQSKEPQRKNP